VSNNTHYCVHISFLETFIITTITVLFNPGQSTGSFTNYYYYYCACNDGPDCAV